MVVEWRVKERKLAGRESLYNIPSQETLAKRAAVEQWKTLDHKGLR